MVALVLAVLCLLLLLFFCAGAVLVLVLVVVVAVAVVVVAVVVFVVVVVVVAVVVVVVLVLVLVVVVVVVVVFVVGLTIQHHSPQPCELILYGLLAAANKTYVEPVGTPAILSYFRASFRQLFTSSRSEHLVSESAPIYWRW